MIKRLQCLFLVYLCLGWMTSFALAKSDPKINFAKKTITRGSTIMFSLEDLQNKFTEMKVVYKNKNIPLMPVNSRIKVGFIPVDYNEKEKVSKLVIYWRDQHILRSQTATIKIVDAQYPTTNLTVDPSRVKLSKKNINRVKREKQEISKIYNKSHYKKLWQKPFILPVDSIITSPYGCMRIFNGKLASFHTGVDLRAYEGTPIKAMNGGIVRFAKETFYGGNTVIIDHGLGLFSTYGHLSKFSVNVGTFVKRGQQVGLSGATGRVNGAHLHWGVKLQGVLVNPVQFVKGYKGFIAGLLSKNTRKGEVVSYGGK